MAIAQPQSGDPLNTTGEDHATLHRIIAADPTAATQSFTIDSSGHPGGGAVGVAAYKLVQFDSSGKYPAADGSQITGIVAIPTGTVLQYAGSVAPTGFLLCDGSAVSQTTYAALYTIIGTSFNTGGEGGGNFRLPNAKGKVVSGYDSTQTEFNALGKTGGEKTHTLSSTEMPAHTHPVTTSAPGGDSGWNANYGTLQQTDNTGSTGGGSSHNNLQPYITMNYIIKT